MVNKLSDQMTVSFLLPVDRTTEEVQQALEALGATRIRVYPPQRPTERPMHGGYPE